MMSQILLHRAAIRPRRLVFPALHVPTALPSHCRRWLSTSAAAAEAAALSSGRGHQKTKAPTYRWLFAASVGAASGTAYAVHYFHNHFGGREGLSRAVTFYSVALPKYAVYRYHQWRESPAAVWEQLDRETSQQGLDIILQLKGFYVKCGQMCASNVGDAFPVIWQETMSILQDQVPSEDFESVIRPILREELDHEKTFASFEAVPIGSASIGQVHRATLVDGRDVVVKICYPHVERLLRGDVRTITAFCEVAQPVHVPALKEIERQFPSEFDYRTEAANLELVRENLTRAGLCGPDRLCLMPRAYREHCTRRVLVMEELHGEKLVDVLKRDAVRWAAVLAAVGSAGAGGAADGTTPPSPRPLLENVDRPVTAAEFDSYLAGLDAARRAKNAWTRVTNVTVRLFGAAQPYQSKANLPLNPAQLVDDLLHIHGHQVLVDGRFNADCHPGAFAEGPVSPMFCANFLFSSSRSHLCPGSF